MIERVIFILILSASSFLQFTSIRKTRFLAFSYRAKPQSEKMLGPSMGHFNLKSESFAYSSFLSLADVRNYERSNVWNISNICILIKFYFAHNFIAFWITWNLVSFEVCFPTKNSAKNYFLKNHGDAKANVR